MVGSDTFVFEDFILVMLLCNEALMSGWMLLQSLEFGKLLILFPRWSYSLDSSVMLLNVEISLGLFWSFRKEGIIGAKNTERLSVLLVTLYWSSDPLQ